MRSRRVSSIDCCCCKEAFLRQYSMADVTMIRLNQPSNEPSPLKSSSFRNIFINPFCNTSCASSGDPAYRRHSAYIFGANRRSEEHTSELQSLMRISYAVFCLKKK